MLYVAVLLLDVPKMPLCSLSASSLYKFCAIFHTDCVVRNLSQTTFQALVT